MITGFERETADLTEYELLEIVPQVADILRSRRGKKNAIPSERVIGMLDGPCSGARLRKIINHIRVKGIIKCLVASSKGYYVSDDFGELDAYCGSLWGREQAIAQVRRALCAQMEELETVGYTLF